MEYLPNEIMIQILSYLPTIDLIQFSRAFEDYSYFLKERHVIENINFKRMFDLSEFHFCDFIVTHLGYNYIRILNVEGLYWIPLHDMRRLISKLDNLEELYAVDTLLGMRTKDIYLYGRLKKLSISVEANHFDNVSSDDYFNVFYKLKQLFVKFIDKKDIFDDLYFFLGTLRQLNELWINDDDQKYGLNYNKIVATIPSLNKLVIKSKRPIPLLDFSCWGLLKVFQNKRYEFEVENIFERVSLLEYGEQQMINTTDSIEKSWVALKNLHYDMPCGPNDSEVSNYYCRFIVECRRGKPRRWVPQVRNFLKLNIDNVLDLIHLKNDIKNIYFEDLNFCHTIILCNAKYIEAALQILSSNNSSELKRLALRTCVFLGNLQNNEEPHSKKLKKRRIGVQVSATHPFEKVAGNLKNLTQLEISLCSSCITGSILSAYHTITLFKNLEKLSLEISHLMDGLFLKEVFIRCDKLKSLRLKCMSQNEKFMINLSDMLKYATSLRDLRLEHINIDMDRMFEGLIAIQEKKLLRLFLKCDTLKAVSEQYTPLQKFMEKNRQLIFFFLVVSKNTVKQKSNIQKIFNSCKGGNPAKIFYVKKDIHSFSGAFPIPTAHHDIIFNRTYVSVINFDEF